MVDLQFEIDEAVLQGDLESNPEGADAAALQETYFSMPVRFAADGIDLFAWKQSGRVIIVDESGGSTLLAHEREAHLCIPILHLAGIGYDVIRNLNKVGKANYAPPGGESLNFELCGSEVCIRGTINMTEIKVGYQELLNAFEAYRASVRVFLNERVPKLRLHSHWGAWLEVCP